MERITPQIYDTFTNIKGEHFDNVREVRYEEGKTINSFGTLIGESGKNPELLDGAYIYQSFVDPTKVYKIYKDYRFYNYLGHRDEQFISKLRECGKNLKLTDLPTGVVTLGGNTIGQETVYAQGITLNKFCRKNKDKQLLINIYIQILDIFKELYMNKIYYLDIHDRNFIVNKGIVKLIDFESDFIKLGSMLSSDKIIIFNHLRMLINDLNKKCNIQYQIETINDFDDAYEKVFQLEKNI